MLFMHAKETYWMKLIFPELALLIQIFIAIVFKIRNKLSHVRYQIIVSSIIPMMGFFFEHDVLRKNSFD